MKHLRLRGKSAAEVLGRRTEWGLWLRARWLARERLCEFMPGQRVGVEVLVMPAAERDAVGGIVAGGEIRARYDVGGVEVGIGFTAGELAGPAIEHQYGQLPLFVAVVRSPVQSVHLSFSCRETAPRLPRIRFGVGPRFLLTAQARARRGPAERESAAAGMEGRASSSDRAKALVKASSLDERGAVVRLSQPEETERKLKAQAKLRGGESNVPRCKRVNALGQRAQAQCAGLLCIEDEP
jgi:hypothetical protein